MKDLVSEPGATGILSDYKDRTDPKYIGPGTWDVIHRRAFKARTRAQQLSFAEFMKDVCHTFPCFVCKGHCTEYIKNHPLEEHIGVLVDINGEQIALGIFVWTWKFHNAVNARLGKPIMSWETAYNIFSDTENLVCSKNCLEADGPQKGSHIPNVPSAHKATSLVPKIPEFKSTTSVTKPVDQTFRLISVNRK